MFTRIRAALAAFIAPEMLHTPAPTTSEATDNTLTGGVSDQATAVQTRNVGRDVHVDRSTTHTGPTVTNTNNGGNVGFQTGNVSGGIVNVGGNNRFNNTALGHGTTVNNVDTNNGQIMQADTINGGINY